MSNLKPERRRQATWSSLKAYFEQELRIISQTLEGLEDVLRHRPSGAEKHVLRAEASYLHDIYTSVENCFRRIAEELNGGTPKGDQWHKALLLEMKSDFGAERPPVISEELFALLDELLRFRHLVRNSYGIFLDSKRTRQLSEKAQTTVVQFDKEIHSFLRKVKPQEW